MLNVMGLHSPASAVLSAVVFNAIVIVFLVPLARAVKYRPMNASRTLGRNLAVYGLAGSSHLSLGLGDRPVPADPGLLNPPLPEEAFEKKPSS
ncbi:hypothetical protein QJS66_13935 [Kocuria rhizophila]|nr:hypothetical protein QJS66_13935 [Kocuria rhizophila]